MGSEIVKSQSLQTEVKYVQRM